MFGTKVTKRIQTDYSDAFYTAHFEVPGEMFTLAMQAQVNETFFFQFFKFEETNFFIA